MVFNSVLSAACAESSEFWYCKPITTHILIYTPILFHASLCQAFNMCYLFRVMSRYQNAGQNNNIKRGNKSFETVEQFKYLVTTLTNSMEQSPS
jgi:hypothetical protein